MGYIKRGMIMAVLIINILSETAHGSVVPTNQTSVKSGPGVKPDVKHLTDTQINDNSGTRVVSGLEVYAGGAAGVAGPPGPMGPAGPQGPPGSTTGGVNYIRWGRTTCPGTEGTQLVYSGVTAGSHWNQKGGGAEYLCLPGQPEFLQVTAGLQSTRNKLYGAFYHANENPPAFDNIKNHNAPCAACSTSARGQKIMIPGKVNCTSSWTREYYGYLMTERTHQDHLRSSYVCVDVNAEAVPGSGGFNYSGALLDFVEAVCNGIKCPPYTAGYELPCVVCTK